MNLSGKVALVTGGGRDIGRSVSLRLAKAGATVIVNFANNADAANDTVRAITDAGGSARAHRADVTDMAAVQAMVDGVKSDHGRIDILVNLAGGMVARKPIEEQDEGFYDQLMDLNLKSAWAVTRAAKPLMGKGASIVNVSSLAGRDGGGPGASLYATAKGALMTLTRAWAKEFGPQGIRVNAVCPGLIGTSFHDIFSKPEGRAAVAGNTPLRREGHPDEVAEAIVWLASDDSGFLTGVNMDINGGLGFS